MVELMNEVRLSNARIEQLIDRLYTINKELVQLEGKLLAPRHQLRRQARRIP
jgi:RNA polymerase primary sigma factor